jgi:hypothetical protein
MGDVESAAARARELYVAGDHAAALEAYTDALSLADEAPEPEATKLYATLYGNRSASRLHLGQFAAAAHDAALALAAGPTEWRPRLRLARALWELGRLDAAEQEASHVLALSSVPPHGAAEAASLARRARQAADATAKDDTNAHGALNNGALFEPQQILRVHLCAPLPVALTCGRWHTLSLRLTNEMGCFDAQCFAAASEGEAHLTVLGLSGPCSPLILRVRQAPHPVPSPGAQGKALRDAMLSGNGCVSPDKVNEENELEACHLSSRVQLHRGQATVDFRLDLDHATPSA